MLYNKSDYVTRKLKYHYQPQKGWRNDPNGLVFFKGYYHLYYQHIPDSNAPGKPMCWGHARTKDFITWEELPLALIPSQPFDKDGCWSGTAIVKDDVLYVFYAGIQLRVGERHWESINVAYSTDGITFQKYEKNPIIQQYPSDGGPDFRDPAVAYVNGKYKMIVATGNPNDKEARLLMYESDNLFDWTYIGIVSEWENSMYAECPSLVHYGENYLLTASIVIKEDNRFFTAMYGNFQQEKFIPLASNEIEKGPDQYAGQVFTDYKNRNIFISWIPGWQYVNYADEDFGCFCIPRELKYENGKIYAYPVEELRHLLKENDPAIKFTDDGFIVERSNRSTAVYKGKINDIKVLRDEFILEIFINGGETNYTILL